MNLSIIIPFYNAERTIYRCIDSILADAYTDYQIIIVDDGSEDSCSYICDQYAQKDDRIIVIHKDNGGLGSARNVGINKAEGKYITFIDSDDAIKKGTITSLMGILDKHKEYDILEYPIYEHFDSISRQNLRMFSDYEYYTAKEYWFKTKAYLHTYACNKIYKRSLFDGCLYKEHCCFEDCFMLPNLLKRCKVIATTSLGTYYYYVNKKGITEMAGAKESTDLLNAHLSLIDTPLSPIISSDYYLRLLNIQMDLYELIGGLPIIPQYNGNYWNVSPKVLLSKLIGIKGICQLNKFIHKKIYHRSH